MSHHLPLKTLPRRLVFKSLLRIANQLRRRGKMGAYYKTLGLAMRVIVGKDGSEI